jgi:hypothetical protein
MNIMKNKWILGAAAAVLTAVTAQAIPVTGSITFAGGVNLDTGSAGTATTVTAWYGPDPDPDPIVVSRSGSFAAFVPNLSPATFTAPYTFVSGAHPALWTVGGFTFNLLFSVIDAQTAGSVSAMGIGIITGNGFDPTFATWRFSTQDPSAVEDGRGAVFSFSASDGATGRVPEGGTTLVLLGVALSGLGLLRRKLVA